jgi:hypothetical protein
VTIEKNQAENLPVIAALVYSALSSIDRSSLAWRTVLQWKVGQKSADLVGFQP